jgi:antitoxin component YwqK of YwqJK toxin-antitoxin module
MKNISTTKIEHDKGSFSIRQEKESKLHGWWIVFNNDNSKQWERFYINGEQNGPEKTWYSNRKLKSECSFVDGKLNGSWKTWFDNGQLQNESWFTNGEQDLFSRWYDKSGILITDLIIFNGVKHGTEIAQVIVDEVTCKTTRAIVKFENGIWKGYEPISEDEEK